MTREKIVGEVLNSLLVLPLSLNKIIVEYDKFMEWGSQPRIRWEMKYPLGMCTDNYLLYLSLQDSVAIYNRHNKNIKNSAWKLSGRGLDIDTKSSLLYLADQTHVTVFNFQLNIVASWALPSTSIDIQRSIKVDHETVYITIYGKHQIYACHASDGKLLKKWGTRMPSSTPRLFNCPTGLTCDTEYVYICDERNHRVQILTKDGLFVTQWGIGKKGKKKGQFTLPSVINYSSIDCLVYVADSYCIQVFNRENVCVQRIGERNNRESKNTKQKHPSRHQLVTHLYSGICVFNEKLYVSDYLNQRIEIYKKSKKVTVGPPKVSSFFPFSLCSKT